MKELYDKKSSKQMIQWTLSLLGFKVMILFVESLPLSIEYDDDTHLDTCHRIWQHDTANCNIKIASYYWLLICVHVTKTN